MSDDADEVMNGGEKEKLVETSDDAVEASTTVSEEKQEEVTISTTRYYCPTSFAGWFCQQ